MTAQGRRLVTYALTCGALLSAIIGVRLCFPSAQYAAKARIKVDHELDSTNSYSATFMQNEFELIQSDTILAKVIDSLGLDKKWSKQTGRKLPMADALVMLKSRLELQPIRCTSLVEIRLTSDNREEAAEISNAVAEEYRNYRVTGERTSHSTEIIDAAKPPRDRVTPNRIPALCWFGLAMALGFAGICTFRTSTGATN